MAIEYTTKNLEGAAEALKDMPPRSEEELDPVTLHNTALCDMATDPPAGFRKLQHLLRNPPHPPETLGNLVLLYVRHQLLDLAADALADYEDLHEACLSAELKDYLQSLVVGHGSDQGQAEAYRKLEIQASRSVDTLRRRAKLIQDARHTQDEDAVREALASYDASLDEYIPVLMAQAKIYWEREHYPMVERLMKQAAEFCSDHPVWKLNVAHVFFMQDDKFRDAIRYYEPLVHSHMESSILEVSAIVLANLCVAYIMTSQNESAAEVMREIEREEKRLSAIDPDTLHYHLCIVNLVIGTLYCSKGNFEFGLDRVLKSLDPLPAKLSPDTWYHAKRCFLALADTAAKQMIVIKDAFYDDIVNFLVR
jgi:tetratricopeptide repeat protein 30